MRKSWILSSLLALFSMTVLVTNAHGMFEIQIVPWGKMQAISLITFFHIRYMLVYFDILCQIKYIIKIKPQFLFIVLLNVATRKSKLTDVTCLFFYGMALLCNGSQPWLFIMTHRPVVVVSWLRPPGFRLSYIRQNGLGDCNTCGSCCPCGAGPDVCITGFRSASFS